MNWLTTHLKRAAIIHTVLCALAVIPSIGLAIGLALSGANSSNKTLGAFVVYGGSAFPALLVLSPIIVWIGYAAGWRRIASGAIVLPWLLLLMLIAATLLLVGLE